MSKLVKFFAKPGEFWRDFWLKRYPGGLDAGSADRRLPRRTPAAPSAPARLGRAASRVAEPDRDVLEAYPVTFPIDIVYTWVDGDDPTWLAKKSAVLAMTDATPAATTPARFACRGELKYSLRSVEYYAPWVNHIYIVTDSQVPAWLDTAHGKVTVVDHREIIPAEYLPTFNSHVIEAHLHRIPGLTERYLYFNDDVMLTRPTTPEYFFAANGNAHLFLTRAQTRVGPVTIYDTPTQVAAKNARELLNRRFGHYMLFNFAHTFHPQLKSVNEQVAEEFAPEVAASCRNRFRGSTDLAFATYLAPNYAYLTGRADLRTTACMYFNVRAPLVQRHYRDLLERKGTARAPHSMCLNDIRVVGACDEKLLQQEGAFLDRYYPEPSDFERAALDETVVEEPLASTERAEVESVPPLSPEPSDGTVPVTRHLRALG